MRKGIKLIIFDFDGVLADSFDTFYPLIRDAMSHAGLSLTQNQYRDFFIGNVHQGFKDFINNKKKYLAFSEFRKTNYDKYYYDGNGKVKLFPGAIEFLRKIGKGYILTVASSGKEDNIKNLLEKNGVKKLFSLILANTANSKEGMIQEILYKFKAIPEETIMVTDTVGDLKVAKKVGLKTAAATWGFHSAKKLKLEKPDYLANSFKMLYKNIKAF
ncbi:MAG: HAD family hydrolase [bacterium]|nr:HAD family hydrolase [bacterium]